MRAPSIDILAEFPKNAKKGACYHNVIAFIKLNPDWTVVHGICVSTGEDRGSKIGHAWAEKTFVIETPVGSVEMTVCADPGTRMIVPKGVYYNVGKVGLIQRYTRDEVIALLRKTKHCGPWNAEIDKAKHRSEK